jgi:hypothetical protein
MCMCMHAFDTHAHTDGADVQLEDSESKVSTDQVILWRVCVCIMMVNMHTSHTHLNTNTHKHTQSEGGGPSRVDPTVLTHLVNFVQHAGSLLLTFVQVSACVCVFVCVCLCVCVCVFVCLCTIVRVRIRVNMYRVFIHMSINTRTHAYTHTHTYIPPFSRCGLSQFPQRHSTRNLSPTTARASQRGSTQR